MDVGPELDGRKGCGVREGEGVRVQMESVGRGTSVAGIAEDGESSFACMHSDLVGSTGVRNGTERPATGGVVDQFEGGFGVETGGAGLGAVCQRGGRFGELGPEANGEGAGVAIGLEPVGFLECSESELLSKALVGEGGFGEGQDTGGAFV